MEERKQLRYRAKKQKEGFFTVKVRRQPLHLLVR